jgi:glycosyltransferase involved in cell wall biosynthesis
MRPLSDRQIMQNDSTAAAKRRSLDPNVRSRTMLVIPAFNEATRVGEVIESVRRSYPHVVVVDDGSSDQTATVARQAGAFVLRHVVNRGQGAALQTGITFALRRGADYIVTFDADGQHRISDIAALLEPIVTGEVEIALGSRFMGKAVRIPPLRRLVLSLAVLFTRVVSGVVVTDAHNGLRAFSRRAAAGIDIRNDRMAHASELIDIIRALDLPYREVPVKIKYTSESLAKGQSLRGAARILIHYLVGRVAA